MKDGPAKFRTEPSNESPHTGLLLQRRCTSAACLQGLPKIYLRRPSHLHSTNYWQKLKMSTRKPEHDFQTSLTSPSATQISKAMQQQPLCILWSELTCRRFTAKRCKSHMWLLVNSKPTDVHPDSLLIHLQIRKTYPEPTFYMNPKHTRCQAELTVTRQISSSYFQSSNTDDIVLQ